MSLRHPREASFLPADAAAWADEHAAILDLIAASLIGSGEWPEVASLTRELVRRGQPVPLSSLLESLPTALGFQEGYPRRVVLLLFGLAVTDAGERVLAGLFAVLQLARERFEGDAAEPRITEADLRALGTDERVANVTIEVLQREVPFLQAASRGANEEWSAAVTEDIVRYWDASGPVDYDEIRAKELFGETAGDWPASPASLSAKATPNDPPRADREVRDVFVSHASEDKDAVARPLSERLIALGHSVWLDEQELVIGDSLSESIDRGLALSRFGVVVLSKEFFSKPWTKRELEGLVARETVNGERVILPVWHGVVAADVLEFSPPLAQRYAASTASGINRVADQVSTAISRRGPGAARFSAFSAPLRSPPVSPPGELREIVDRAVKPPGSPDPWSLYSGVALLQVVATAVPSGLRHPAGDPRHALDHASAEASLIAANWPPDASLLARAFEGGWEPMAPHIWGAGHMNPLLEHLQSRPAAAASFSTRDSVLAVDRTWPTAVTDERGTLAFHAAREPEVAAEMLVTMRLAGVLLGELRGAQAVDVAVIFGSAPDTGHLVSSERAVSGGRFGEPESRISAVADVPPRYLDHARFAVEDLLDPYEPARQLLSPWLAMFRETDLFERLLNG